MGYMDTQNNSPFLEGADMGEPWTDTDQAWLDVLFAKVSQEKTLEQAKKKPAQTEMFEDE